MDERNDSPSHGDPRLQDLDELMSALGGEIAGQGHPRLRGVRYGHRVLLGSAAAALVAFLTVQALRQSDPSPMTAPEEIGLEVESSRPFAVFPTKADDLTVIWLLPEE